MDRADVRKMHRQTPLTPGQDRVTFYREGREEQKVDLALVWTACTYGGKRPWWICPRCGRRVAVLYFPPRHPLSTMACRQCYDLTYRSQRCKADLFPVEKAHRRMQRLARKLKFTGNTEQKYFPPDRPKGMHQRTYACLCQEWRNAWDQRIRAEHDYFIAGAIKVMQRYGGEDEKARLLQALSEGR